MSGGAESWECPDQVAVSDAEKFSLRALGDDKKEAEAVGSGFRQRLSRSLKNRNQRLSVDGEETEQKTDVKAKGGDTRGVG
ncbi:unnamed protein product [Caenorhabditis brenneri]